MRASSILSLGLSLVLALLAVVGVRTYLASERASMAAQAGLARDAVPAITIVVAAKPLRFGNEIRADQLRLLPWPSQTLPTGAFSTIQDAVGSGEEPRYAMAAIEPDEPVLASRITGTGERATLSAALSDGMKAVSIRVNDVLGVAGFVRPGDRVDVLLSRTARGRDGGERSFVDVLLQGVKVLAVDQVADDRSNEPTISRTVTFEVTTAEAQQLTLATNVGTLSLALRNIGSAGVERTQRVTLSDLGGGPVATELAADAQEDLNLNESTILVDAGVKAEPEEVADTGPRFVIIGVTRDTQREEYRVKPE